MGAAVVALTQLFAGNPGKSACASQGYDTRYVSGCSRRERRGRNWYTLCGGKSVLNRLVSTDAQIRFSGGEAWRLEGEGRNYFVIPEIRCVAAVRCTKHTIIYTHRASFSGQSCDLSSKMLCRCPIGACVDDRVDLVASNDTLTPA